MKFWRDGKLIDTSVHRCSVPGDCVFCDGVNIEAAKHGMYAIPFDIPGVYSITDEPHIVLVKLAERVTEGEDQ